MSPCLTCPDCLCLHLMTTPYDPSPMIPRLSYLSILSELSLVTQPQTSSFWLSYSELNNDSYCWFILKQSSMTHLRHHLKILMKILIHQPLLMSSAFNWSLFSQWFDIRLAQNAFVHVLHYHLFALFYVQWNGFQIWSSNRINQIKQLCWIRKILIAFHMHD